jgi:hypothetical protein
MHSVHLFSVHSSDRNSVQIDVTTGISDCPRTFLENSENTTTVSTQICVLTVVYTALQKVGYSSEQTTVGTQLLLCKPSELTVARTVPLLVHNNFNT